MGHPISVLERLHPVAREDDCGQGGRLWPGKGTVDKEEDSSQGGL